MTAPSSRTFLVTGATGRLGRDLSARLEDLGATVLPVVLPGYPMLPKRVPWTAKTAPIDLSDERALGDLPDPDWPAIRWAHGLSYFLGVDDTPASVPDEMVEYLKRRVADWNGSGEAAHRFDEGDTVTVAYGPFAGLDGIFQGYVRAGERCRILLQIVGRLSSIELREYDLEMAAPLP